MADLDRLHLLFHELVQLTGVRDIAYHRIADGRINPVLKTNTDQLDVEKWKQTHAAAHVYVEKDFILNDITLNPLTVVVQDVKKDRRSSEEFFLFGIDSIMILPVLEGSNVIGIVVVASIGSLHHFAENEIKQSELLVEQYKSIFKI